jgi:hypothetical protein
MTLTLAKLKKFFLEEYDEIINGRWANRKDELRAEQRLKVKEIISSLEK